MPSFVIVLPIVTNLLASAVALAVALRMARNVPKGDAGRAVSRFAAWWFGLAGYIATNEIDEIVTLAGIDPVPLHAALTFVGIGVLGVGLWGLVSYVVYLYSGHVRTFAIVTWLYAIQIVAVLAWLARLGPSRLEITDAGAKAVYANPPSAGAGILFALFFLLPPLAGSIALGVLRSRVEDPTTRYRLRAISVGIFVWFALAVLVGGINQPTPLTSVGAPLVAAACMLLIVSAYYPPSWLRSRGIAPFGHGARSPRATPEAAERLAERIRELV